MTFWHLSFLHSKYLLAPSGAGLTPTPLPPILEVQLEAETHPVTVGFSTVWQSLMTGVPRALTQVAYCCVRGPNNLSTGPLSRAALVYPV